MTRSAVAAMTAYTLELREAATKLNQNESPFDLPPQLKQQVVDAIIERSWNRYPDFETTELRGALAAAHGVEPENILVGNGSNELLAAAVSTFVGPGTPVIVQRPSFTLYEKLVTIAGGKVVAVAVDPASALLPLDELVPAAESVERAVVIVCSPNNPTGGVLAEGGIDRLLATGATVLYDRAYGDFVGDAAGCAVIPSREEGEESPAQERSSLRTRRIPRRAAPARDDIVIKPNLVTFSTFSKAWGLAGLRIGWLSATAETCREIRKVKLPYSLNIFSEAAAIVALQNRGIRDANVRTLVAERDRLAAALAALPRIEVFPSAANFISFRTTRNAKEIFDALIARGFLIRDISSYSGLANCLRVSVGTEAENDAFAAELKELL